MAPAGGGDRVGRLLIPEQAVVLDTDRERAHQIARRHLRRYLPLRNTANLIRLGFTTGDLEHEGSDRLIDALIAWGDEQRIADRITAHRQAGADHVCLQVLEPDPRALPRAQWRRLATLTDIGGTGSPPGRSPGKSPGKSGFPPWLGFVIVDVPQGTDPIPG